MKCIVPDCPDDSRSKGMCQKHYIRHWKFGDYTKLLLGPRDSSKDEMLRVYSNHPNVMASIRGLSVITGLSRHCVAKALTV